MFSSGYQGALHFETKSILLALFLSPAADFLLYSFFFKKIGTLHFLSVTDTSLSFHSGCSYHHFSKTAFLRARTLVATDDLHIGRADGYVLFFLLILSFWQPFLTPTAVSFLKYSLLLSWQPYYYSLLSFYSSDWPFLFLCCEPPAQHCFIFCPFFHCYLFHSPALIISYHLFSRISPSVISTNSTMYIKFKFSSPQIQSCLGRSYQLRVFTHNALLDISTWASNSHLQHDIQTQFLIAIHFPSSLFPLKVSLSWKVLPSLSCLKSDILVLLSQLILQVPSCPVSTTKIHSKSLTPKICFDYFPPSFI